MQQSVPSPSVLQATFAATLFDEWCRSGLTDVVLCPGSRSTPLALAAAGRPELVVHVRIDERSAGFFALGRAMRTRRPVAIVVTSGTAAAELHAVVAEADLANVALLVLTADRPPELHHVGAPQTMDQRALFAGMVRRFEEPGVARLASAESWRPLASRLWSSAAGVSAWAGPVHLNAAFVEPLVGEPIATPSGRAANRPWRTYHRPPEVDGAFAVNAQRVLAVVGHGVGRETIEECTALGWAVLGDATAEGSVAYFDALLRDEGFADAARPDLVVRLGGLPASKVLQNQLRRWGRPTVAFAGAGPVADPDGAVSEVVAGLPRGDASALRADPRYDAWWRAASASVEEWFSISEQEESGLSEPYVARSVVAASSLHQVPLVIGSSMPVRDVEWWTPPRTCATFSNRGVSGIDGVVSTALGTAVSGRSLALMGDLTFLHDVSGLVDGLGEAGGCCVLVVVNNHGGGIFSFLDQASTMTKDSFDRLLATPRSADLVALARAFGHRGVRVATRGELRSALDDGLEESGLTVIEAPVPDGAQNVRRHDALNRAVRDCWSRNDS